MIDVVIIGGGIVGLATAYQLTREYPRRSVLVLDKESALARHQTGRNSGVIHSGVYYRPGSRKAIECRAGKAALESFCREHGVATDRCGKVIVAVTEAELPRLAALHDRAEANGVHCRLIERAELSEIEPSTAGLRALHVPETGIVDYPAVCEKLAQLIREHGGDLWTDAAATAIESRHESVVIRTPRGDVESRWAVNCAGLHSDRVAVLAGARPQAQIIPFRGEYFRLKPEAERLCRHLIYPVPDPQFPFLGVHFTRMIRGGVECGPNAVLAFGREAYRKTQVVLSDVVEMARFGGFHRLVLKHWRMGLGEWWRSCSRSAFVSALQRLVPEIRGEHLEPAPAGIRAQAVAPDGALVDDFVFVEQPRMVHVLNAPSPAATAALSIGGTIVKTLAKRFDAAASSS